jgi:pSer/pThr/pTyr-binding forkhead associated (FHA) protein
VFKKFILVDFVFLMDSECRDVNNLLTPSQQNHFQSSYGTYVNHKRLEKDEPFRVRDGDEISFGPNSNFKYVFYTKDISMNPAKRMRLDEYV